MILFNLSTYATYIFYLFGTTFFCAILNGSYYFYKLYYSNIPLKREYEYIIIGTGTAGSIVASGIPSKDMLIIEAGSMRSPLMDIPLFQPLLQGTHYDWQYKTEPQSNACWALAENRSYWPMGKVFGGTSMLNNMIHYKAEKQDFNGWFDGNSEQDLFMEYFEKDWDESSHVAMDELSFVTKLGSAFVEAADTIGLDRRYFYRPNVTTQQGKRWTTSHHYWKSHPECHEIIFNALVTKITIENGKAKGVIFEKGGQMFEVTASNGIILSAGTVGSPKILLQSGIGPKDHLKALGIQPLVNLKVGENLQDHISTGMDLVILSKNLPLSVRDLIRPQNIKNYFFNDGKNSSLSFGGCECLGFLKSYADTVSKIGFMVLPVGITVDGGSHLRSLINLRENIWENYFRPLVDMGQQSVSILPILLHPKSKGYIRLRNADPHSSPIIEPNYLHEEEDVEVLITGIKALERILNAQPMRELGAEISPKTFPGCEKHSFGSNDYWKCYIKSFTLTLYHPVGTCRMGKADDPDAVVSNKDFKVHSVDNLYVVDGSIMPALPSGNPNSVIAALATYFLKQIFFVPSRGPNQ